tara:strand:+ start:390 stop:539 length:150 start_codon:yes stop_codon:yes gene_type:complete
MSIAHLFAARVSFSDGFGENFSFITAMGFWHGPFVHAVDEVHTEDGREE